MQDKEINKKQIVQIKQTVQIEPILMDLLDSIYTPIHNNITKRYIIPTYINEHSGERKE